MAPWGELWGSNGAGDGEWGHRADGSMSLCGVSSDNGRCTGLALCWWRDTASARSVAGRFGSTVLRWLGRGKRSTAVGTDLIYAAATKAGGAVVHGLNRTVEWRLASDSAPASP